MEEQKRIGLQIKSIHHLVLRTIGSDRCDNSGVTGGNIWLIAYMAKCAEIGRDVYQKDIEDAFGITRSTVSRVVDLMEKKGLIARCSVEHDARLKKLVLTDNAKSIASQMRSDAERIESMMTQGFSPDELKTLSSYLERLQHNLECKNSFKE